MRTRKPCPGCGVVHQYRAANGVCSDCERWIRIGQTTEATEEKQPEGTRIYALAEVDHWNPQLTPTQIETDIRDELGSAFWQLCWKLVKRRTKRGKPNYAFPDEIEGNLIDAEEMRHYLTGLHNPVQVYVKPSMAKALTRLFVAIWNAIKDAERIGRERGDNMLCRIARGEISIAQLNEMTLGEDK